MSYSTVSLVTRTLPASSRCSSSVCGMYKWVNELKCSVIYTCLGYAPISHTAQLHANTCWRWDDDLLTKALSLLLPRGHCQCFPAGAPWEVHIQASICLARCDMVFLSLLWADSPKLSYNICNINRKLFLIAYHLVEERAADGGR